MTLSEISVLRKAVETSRVYHMNNGKSLDRVLHLGQTIVSRGFNGSHYAEVAFLVDDSHVRLDLETCQLTDFCVVTNLPRPS